MEGQISRCVQITEKGMEKQINQKTWNRATEEGSLTEPIFLCSLYSLLFCVQTCHPHLSADLHTGVHLFSHILCFSKLSTIIPSNRDISVFSVLFYSVILYDLL